MIADGGRAGIERAGVGADDPLAEIGILQPLVLEITLDELRHRPMEEHLAGFLIVAQASVDLLLGGRVADPNIAIAGGPQSIAQAPDHGGHRFPAIHIAGSKAPDLFFAGIVVIPELHAGAIEKGNKEAVRSGRPMKTAIHQSQLIDHQRMEKSGKISARRHADAGEGLFDGAGASDARPAFEHQDALAGACQVGSAGEAVMTGADDDGVPRPRSQLRNGLREADLAQDGGCGRGRAAKRRTFYALPRSRSSTRRLRFEGFPATSASKRGIALRSSASCRRKARLASVSRYSVCATAAGPRTSLRSSTST